jgi:predicted nucleic acid-binding Zn ribbon protein
MHRISQTPSLECAACGANELKKLISAVGFQLKGTGWYETDFKNKGEAKSERTSGESNSDKTAPNKKDSDTEKKSAASESKSASKKSDAAKSDN